MSNKSPQDVFAETEALIAQTEAQLKENERVMAEGMAELARLMGKDPSNFDLERHLRESMSTADFEKLMEDGRQKMAEGGLLDTSEAPAPAPTRPTASRANRRMV
jgi:hypothetical protein